MEQEQLGMGAQESIIDPRTLKFKSDLAGIMTEGGVEYSPEDIEHQHVVGICTGISRVQLRQKQTGKKYSPDFQYLMQKKFYDKAWYEGSSILTANKVAYNIGFLPAELWTHTTEADRSLPYNEYIAKLQAIPDAEIERLAGKRDINGVWKGGLCVDKIPGYRSIDINDPEVIAKAIIDSPKQAGILCRYDCGSTWWIPSWRPEDINPLRKPVPATSGHAIIMSKFNYLTTIMQKLSNTWGTLWCLKGCADIDWSNYKPTEAWMDTTKFIFTKTLRYGQRSDDVKELQKVLGVIQTGYFGAMTFLALKKFQIEHGLKSDGVAGPRTNSVLNAL